jgi:2-oxoglutarate dehydrogenase E2 component (dihydrolipoamide succinyltransferase)
MAQYELLLPKMGESVAEATITQWLKQPGDSIAMDESVLTIATDKVDSDVPSPVAGTLVKWLYEVNDVVQVGQALALVETESGSASATAPASAAAAPQASASAPDAPAAAEAPEAIPFVPTTEALPVGRTSSGRFYSPLVRSIAAKEGLGAAELDQIPGSGADGRLNKADLLAYLANRGSASAPAALAAPAVSAPVAAAPAASSTPKTSSYSPQEGDEIIEMDRMRKLIADHMVMSKSTSPHVTSFVEADVTNLVRWRDNVKQAFEKREGEKITFTPIFIEAVAKAIKDFPMINISIDGDKIYRHKNINIGMATALPTGNLIVPVIKNADQLNLSGITKQVNALANRARTNQLKPDDIQGGTYTLTNVGSFGNVMGTPIINQPQVAILAVGAIRKMPAVVETPEGDMIAIRHKIILSHSYDHRVVDGALGGMFVRRVADYLEAWDVNRNI